MRQQINFFLVAVMPFGHGTQRQENKCNKYLVNAKRMRTQLIKHAKTI